MLLRQNPHNVGEWHKRVELNKETPSEVITTFMNAVKTIDPKKTSNGRFSSIWIAFAHFYDQHGQLDDVSSSWKIYFKLVGIIFIRKIFTFFISMNYFRFCQARIIFERALEVNYAKVEELADVWCAYAELELKHEFVVFELKIDRYVTGRVFFSGNQIAQSHFFNEPQHLPPERPRTLTRLKLFRIVFIAR